MRQLRTEERWAQACIQQALPDCTVEPHDDGSEPGMSALQWTACNSPSTEITQIDPEISARWGADVGHAAGQGVPRF